MFRFFGGRKYPFWECLGYLDGRNEKIMSEFNTWQKGNQRTSSTPLSKIKTVCSHGQYAKSLFSTLCSFGFIHNTSTTACGHCCFLLNITAIHLHKCLDLNGGKMQITCIGLIYNAWTNSCSDSSENNSKKPQRHYLYLTPFTTDN